MGHSVKLEELGANGRAGRCGRRKVVGVCYQDPETDQDRSVVACEEEGEAIVLTLRFGEGLLQEVVLLSASDVAALRAALALLDVPACRT